MTLGTTTRPKMPLSLNNREVNLQFHYQLVHVPDALQTVPEFSQMVLYVRLVVARLATVAYSVEIKIRYQHVLVLSIFSRMVWYIV